MKRKALGKGLQALIPEAPEARGEEIVSVKADAIVTGPFQPRRRMDKAAIARLAESIRENGLIHPLLVRRRSGGLELVAGERRLRAARQAGLERVPVVVRELSDEKALELALIENIQREELNPVEEGEAYRQLIQTFGLNQEEVASRVGKDRATVANTIRLLKLPEAVRRHLERGEISMGHARALLSVPGAAAQNRLCRRIIDEGLSVRSVEALAGALSEKKKPRHKARRPADPNVREAESRLEQRLGTRVRIQKRAGRGRVEIHFFSDEELDRIYSALVKLNI